MKNKPPAFSALLTFCLTILFGLSFLASLSHAVELAGPVGTLKFGKIQINRRSIFSSGDPIEQHFPYSWANKIHVTTRENYVRQELLFKEGDPFDLTLVAESERVLRLRPIFRYVSISTSVAVNGAVDVMIQTEDVWTTTVQLAYGVAEGGNFYELGFLERNFLGTGKSVGAFIRHDIDRLTRGATFRDPHLLHSPYELFTGYGRDEKGAEWQVEAKRPYRSQLSAHSEGTLVFTSSNEDRLFDRGEETAVFHHDEKRIRNYFSGAPVRSMSVAHRVGLAQEYEKDLFHSPRIGTLVPQDRTVSAALIMYEYRQAYFHKYRGLTTFDRQEDLNLGWDFIFEAGPSLEAFGATTDGALGRALLQKSWMFKSKHVSQVRLMGETRWQQQRYENAQVWVQNFNRFQINQKQSFLMVEDIQLGYDLDDENQYLLGGDTGLRGYPVREFSGNKKILITIEHRQTWIEDWLRLMNLGAAIFADTGGAWKENEIVRFDSFNSDIGLGLRLSPSRSFDPTVIRIDVATPLNGHAHSSQFVINIGGSYYFGKPEERKFDQ